MGMFSEVNASENMKKLDGILMEALDKSQEVQDFCKDHLYPWYSWECGEAWSKSNDEIDKAYNK